MIETNIFIDSDENLRVTQHEWGDIPDGVVLKDDQIAQIIRVRFDLTLFEFCDLENLMTLVEDNSQTKE